MFPPFPIVDISPQTLKKAMDGLLEEIKKEDESVYNLLIQLELLVSKFEEATKRIAKQINQIKDENLKEKVREYIKISYMYRATLYLNSENE